MGVLKSIVDFVPNIFNAGATIHATNAAARTAKYNTDATNRANLALADKEFNKNLEMWKMQNAYNSPTEQMARFKAAGLNPNLIYGQGNAGNATMLPKYSAPSVGYNYRSKNYADVLSNFQDTTIRQAQIDNLREQNKTMVLNNAIKAIDVSYKPYKAQNEYELGWQRTQSEGQKTLLQTLDYTYGLKNLNTELAKSSQDLRRKILDNAIRDIDREWAIPNQWINAGSKAINSVLGAGAVSKLGNLGRNYQKQKPTFGELRGTTRVTRYYR